MNQAQLARRDQIADFVRRRIIAAHQVPMRYCNEPYRPRNLPTTEQLANDLLADAEFRALQLGSWLGTEDGEIITEAVGLVIPPYLRPEYEFVANGLELAAELQQRE